MECAVTLFARKRERSVFYWIQSVWVRVWQSCFSNEKMLDHLLSNLYMFRHRKMLTIEKFNSPCANNLFSISNVCRFNHQETFAFRYKCSGCAKLWIVASVQWSFNQIAPLKWIQALKHAIKSDGFQGLCSLWKQMADSMTFLLFQCTMLKFYLLYHLFKFIIAIHSHGL